MGRLLVRVFLASCFLFVVGFLLTIGTLLWLCGQWIVHLSVGTPLVLSFARPDMGFLLILALYFFAFVPIIFLVFLAVEGVARKHRRGSRPAPPAELPADPEHEPTVAILTAYNDAASIGLAVDDFRKVPCIEQVIVVDNNSTDRTTEVAEAHGATVTHEGRQGYGYACMAGLRYALEHTAAERILLSEGDMTFFSSDAEKLLPYLNDCDLVLGSRTNRMLTRDGSQMDWFMVWGNGFLAYLIRLRYWDPVFLGQVRLTDVGCTFRVIRRAALKKIIDQLTVGGNFFSPHMILVALRAGVTVIEVPIKFRERVGVSKGAGSGRARAMLIGLQMLREITFH